MTFTMITALRTNTVLGARAVPISTGRLDEKIIVMKKDKWRMSDTYDQEMKSAIIITTGT
ncbi:unnamed protein product [marine sediment metagenome]|uniref:Uncharacterized protein n=1 Tax=marine sediment metagenome TaxID=412755 RepID=X1RWL3_9ZZZZ